MVLRPPYNQVVLGATNVKRVWRTRLQHINSFGGFGCLQNVQSFLRDGGGGRGGEEDLQPLHVRSTCCMYETKKLMSDYVYMPCLH